MAGDYDVIVIGAGFAGATAARECATRGLRTLVLEARDRIGGRTWTSELSGGDVIEIGGTYLHWLQPHAWSEITRYGFEDDLVEGSVELEWALVPRGDGLEWCTYEEYGVREKRLLERFFEGSRAALPRPYDPLYAREEVDRLDQVSVRDRLDQLGLDADDDALLTSLFATETAGADTTSSFLGLMRWWAPAGHGYEAMEEAVFGYKLRSGMVKLLEAVLHDGGAELRLESPVARVAAEGEGVVVTCADGAEISAGAVVVATPAGVWPHLEFAPPLPGAQVAAAREGMQAPRASKVNVVLRGEPRRFSITPHVGNPIGFMWTSHMRSADEQVAVVFGSPAMRDASDAAEVTAAIERLLPGVEVLEVVSGTYHDDDEFARGGWPFPAIGQLTTLAPHERFTRHGERVVFATADIAKLWGSFIDGAIESGLRAAREVREILAPPS